MYTISCIIKSYCDSPFLLCSKGGIMSENIQTNTTERLTPCLQKKIDKTTCLVEIHFSSMSTQSVEDKLKRVILHGLEYGKQGKSRKSDG